MPRKKQGHTKESATGGYLKKKTDPGLILIPNESFKHFPVNNELVFKIKKTVSSNIPFSASNEKNDREHIEATKSLNDSNMVLQHEVNNNSIELTPIQDGNKCTNLPRVDLNAGKNENRSPEPLSGCNLTTGVCNVSFKNSLSAESARHVKNNVMSPKRESPITTALNNASSPINKQKSTSPKPGESNSGPWGDTLENQKQQSNEMSGISSLHSGLENKAETQTSYRVSSSEKQSNGLKDAVNPVLDQNCQLPSSVYGKSTSSIENVLTGLQVPDKGKENNSTPYGKTSYLQEILEKKTQKSTFLSKHHSEVSIGKDTFFYSDPKSTITSVNENTAPLKADSKLKLNIPDVPVNEDSNSLASAESQKSFKFHKITSPQNLEQHISKIISENAAIVETLDPIWSRRYFKQTSITGSDSDSKKSSGKMSRMGEEKMNSSHNPFEMSKKSKLQSALLGGSEELNPQKCSSVPSLKEKTQYNNSLVIPPSNNPFSKSAFSVSEDEMKGSAIKSLLSFKQSRNSKNKKNLDLDQNVYHQHPQNPERSIIKDLLLKSKSPEESKTKSEDEKSNSMQFDSHSVYPELKQNFEAHFSDAAANPLLSLRDSAEKFRLKDTSAQAQPLDDLNFQYKIRRQTWAASNTHLTADQEERGKILKKELLKPSSPNKRRKLTDSFSGAPFLQDSSDCFKDITDYKAFPSNLASNLELSPHRSRSQSVHLYGGEVQVLDGLRTKKIKIKSTLTDSAFPRFDKFSDSVVKNPKTFDSDMERDANLAGVVVTIAQPAHNNGGTVHMSSRKPVPSNSPIPFSSEMSAPPAKYSKIEASPIANLSKISQLSDRVNSSLDKAHSLLHPYDFFPGPDSKLPVRKASSSFEFKALSIDSDVPQSSLKVTLSPSNKPFYSPIFSGSEKSFDLSGGKLKDKTPQRVVPTVLFTPSSPTHPSTDTDSTSKSEPVKKFLSPARPTSLPLKKKPFTMVSSTLVSPETPRPKKSCVQLYLNGHAYTYLGLKCSTRSTYCSIYRPQPMFVFQDTNSKLSMYSNWQVMPAKEELCGLTPGQMISFYNSKQRKESELITTNSKLGEPLIFTHSSYWTYRSQDHSDEKSQGTPQSEALLDPIEETTPAVEFIQVSKSENIRKESVISSVGINPDKVILSASDSNSCLEPENTVSEAEEFNNSNEDDDDCQDDGTESLTDSSQPKPPKRVKICEGGFKSNEDYTYVRGRGRGKYVCEECGIRCKKPSMLKKHIRTHTDLRPYKCRHCSFAFKTKGNLTKHMKSKAHHKKCTELGIIPVPTTTDDSQIDEEALAKQIEKKKHLFSDGEDADDDDDEDSDESEDECESDSSSMISSNQAKMLTNGHSKQTTLQEKSSAVSSEESAKAREPVSQHTLEQEAASSLLNLSSFGEPSQWSTSTGDLTDVTSSGETESGSVALRSDQSILSPSHFSSQSITGVIASTRSKNMTEQWLSTETLGHRPRSYSADIPLGGGKESLSKFKLVRALNSENTKTTPVDEMSEFGIREQYSRRYSISVAREARRPRVLNPPEWSRGGISSKWLDGESSDQPMDLSITRDLGKCKAMYAAGMTDSLLGIVTQEESGSEASLAPSLDYGEPYQLKSLPVLSPQVLAEYEASGDGASSEPNLIPGGEEQATFGEAASSRPMFYVQDVPGTESGRKENESGEDPPSPDIADYAVCSPVSPPNLEDSSYYYPQENAAQSSNPDDGNSSRIRAEFIVPNTSSSGGMEEGKCVCRICNKMFAKSSHLRLHVNIHYFERPFRCDNCAVSFRTKGHLQKHKRSVSHYNKVNMNMTFGTPTVDNPRPFKCGDCKIAFRIHGHLAKHLRSKMHIMKLECLGKLPFGMYAEMERSGVSLNEIDTTDCNNSLESLQAMAQKLYQRDPRRMRWQGAEQISDTGCVIPVAPSGASLLDSILPMGEPSYDPTCSTIGMPVSTLPSSLAPSDNEEVKQELSEAETFRMSSLYSDADSAISSLSHYILPQPSTTTTAVAVVAPVNSSQEIVQRVEGSSEKDSLHRSGTCHICGRLFKSAKFLQVHLYCDHPTWNSSLTSEASSSSTSVSSVLSSPELPCDLCGRQFPNQKALQQHLLSHAQPRPFVCELCDAGFTSSSSLVAHKATHQNNSYASTATENRTVQLK